ncbi:MBL fold metallo-hydrolase [Staphylococcus caprae]|uniref:hypothetical protein n=1 Tax=Staphylococcus caprae TaxID=29380 RepID=UPI003905BE4E
MIFHSGRIDEVADDIRALGGAERVLMNHEHESLGGQTHFDAPYYIHQDDKEAVTDTLQVAGTFKDREQLYDDLEVIPAPGHTPGTTLYLWDNGEHRYLFTGDFRFCCKIKIICTSIQNYKSKYCFNSKEFC